MRQRTSSSSRLVRALRGDLDRGPHPPSSGTGEKGKKQAAPKEQLERAAAPAAKGAPAAKRAEAGAEVATRAAAPAEETTRRRRDAAAAAAAAGAAARTREAAARAEARAGAAAAAARRAGPRRSGAEAGKEAAVGRGAPAVARMPRPTEARTLRQLAALLSQAELQAVRRTTRRRKWTSSTCAPTRGASRPGHSPTSTTSP
mmetsp:Transcript_18772/g.42610  ORF Transcript_18772/g.42610 Transcript_18772/m.42610 type:complete len:202 (-) Transcript_18772:61-666(-)